MQTINLKAAEFQQLSLLSPAKINVFFKVLHKREDGFHEISSLYQAISLCDTLQIRLSEKDSFTCSDPLLPADHTNLVMKALDLFRKKTGTSCFFSIHLDKKIPMQAGLGGGSSNAATALWSFVKLARLSISQETLFSWGAELGSDVSFFFSSGAALASGRGEILTDVAPYLSSPFWIVKPKEGLSTAEVYRFCKPNLKKEEKKIFYNDLEEAAFSLAPSLFKIKASLLSFGFEVVVLSGSGTAFFCLENESKFSLEDLKRNFPELQFFFVKPLQKKHLEWYE
ncbi:MAG: 4-(cytidine 5'-diphospho)-2-C-methyl-D-erythritol kinase [Verrucomicrobia bacterium]|nr:4-(cytidine 5'-diphospho)-2-C-methyl-D-erythritol kinase [Verrucomicrobiota bacterium]